MSSALKALLFDVDGTLAETERDGHRVAFNQTFEAHGLPWHWDETRYGELLEISGGSERIAHYAASDHPQWMARAEAAAEITQMHLQKNRHYAELVRAGHIQLRPGLLPLLLQAVNAGLTLAIVTTTSRSNVEALLAATMDPPLRDAFALYVTGDDVTRKKPDPECYEIALRELKLPAAATLAVEDSSNGLRAASGAGIRSLVVPSVYFRKTDFSGAAFIADEFTDVSLSTLRETRSESGRQESN